MIIYIPTQAARPCHAPAPYPAHIAESEEVNTLFRFWCSSKRKAPAHPCT